MVLTRGTRVDVDDLPEEIGLARCRERSCAGRGAPARRDRARATSSRSCAPTGGNRAQAAARLGIGAATLYRKLEAYGGESR